MVNRLLALAAKLSGMGVVMEKVNGGKAYIGGAIAILQGVLNLLNEAMVISTMTELIAFARQLPTDPDVTTIGLGLAAIGIRHGIQKAVDGAK